MAFQNILVNRVTQYIHKHNQSISNFRGRHGETEGVNFANPQEKNCSNSPDKDDWTMSLARLHADSPPVKHESSLPDKVYTE